MGHLCDQILLFICIASATYSRVFLYPKTYYAIGFTCIAAGLLEPDPSLWVTVLRIVAAASPFIPPGLPSKFQIGCDLLAVCLALAVATVPIFEHKRDSAWLVPLFFVAGSAVDALSRYGLRVI